MTTEKRLKDLTTMVQFGLGFLIIALVMGAASIFQTSNLSAEMQRAQYDMGKRAGAQEEQNRMMQSIVSVGEAPKTVKDEAGNEFQTDGFLYVFIQNQ